MKLLLIYPRAPSTFWSFDHVLPFIAKRASFPPLGLLTVAALVPREWDLKLIDLNVEELTEAQIDWADYVFLSGMIVHADSARKVIARCHSAGKTVVAGGPLFTTGYERFPEVRHFVLGEAEEVMPKLVSDIRAGRLQRIYQSDGRPDITRTPIPRWDLLNLRHYATMPLQFSRGCPFNCEFCDIIVMYGRVPRSKTPDQMIAELESLVAAGWRDSIFIVDDNFIGHPARAKAFLRALIAWRRQRAIRFNFTTEASLNLVDDPELLALMVEAGIKRVFVGIESPDARSLAECSKAQNRRRDLADAVRTLHQAGISVMGGFIIGFDSDQAGVFELQKRFIQEAGVVTAMIGLLTALPGTRLFARLQNEGRLLGPSTGNNLDATLNFIPRLDRQKLIDGYRQLLKGLYAPRNYYARLRVFLRDYRPAGPRLHVSRSDLRAFCRSVWIMGVLKPGRREYWKFLTQTAIFYRRAFAEAMNLAIMGHHFRTIAADL